MNFLELRRSLLALEKLPRRLRLTNLSLLDEVSNMTANFSFLGGKEGVYIYVKPNYKTDMNLIELISAVTRLQADSATLRQNSEISIFWEW